MRSAHTVEQVRSAEAALMARLPAGTLMQRAASGLASAVIDLMGSAYGRTVVLLVGSGDNGGDALYAGAVLARRGVAVDAVLLDPAKAHQEGLRALRAAGGRIAADTAAVRRPEVVVDGIVGIGGRPGLREDAVAALAAFAGVPVVAVDTPSGLEVDTGRVDGAHVTAEVTVTFGTHKVTHLVDPGALACGAVHLVDLGLDDLPEPAATALQWADVAALLPVPRPFDHKYTRGVVGVRTGSADFPGAGVLSVAGAGSGFAGMVRYDGGASEAVLAAHPEVVPGSGRVQAWVVGSGGSDQSADLLSRSLADGVPLVVDADALAHVQPPLAVPAVLTPHAGELAAMLRVDRSEVEADQLSHARRAAEAYAAVVLLKGRHSIIADPAGRVRVTTTGTPWLATAGAGDVLAGLVGALLAAGLTPFDAASAASWLHGAAASYAGEGGPLRADLVAQAIPAVAAALLA